MTPPPGTPRDEEPGEPRSSPSLAGELGRHAGHGLTLAVATLLFAWLGVQLDELLGTGSLFVVVGSFVGFGAGFYHMYSQLTGSGRSPDDGDAAGEEDP